MYTPHAIIIATHVPFAKIIGNDDFLPSDVSFLIIFNPIAAPVKDRRPERNCLVVDPNSISNLS
jgi:hypothetical protein